MGTPPDESPGECGNGTASISDRIDRLAERAAADEAQFEPPADPPDESRAIGYLVDGVGDALGVYIDARTGGEFYRFCPEEYAALETAFNTWLSLYAACYGVEMESDVTLRTAAEALIDTHDIVDVARAVTSVGP